MSVMAHTRNVTLAAVVLLSCGDDQQVLGKRSQGNGGSGGAPAGAAGSSGSVSSGRGGAAPGSGGSKGGASGSASGGDSGAPAGGTGAEPSGGTAGSLSGSGGDGGASGGTSGTAGSAGAAGSGGGAGSGGSSGSPAGCDNGCVRSPSMTACPSGQVLWQCFGDHDLQSFQGNCEALPAGNILYCCPSTFLAACPDCPGEGALCTRGRCCTGLSCCSGIPIPPGEEYCAAQCPQ